MTVPFDTKIGLAALLAVLLLAATGPLVPVTEAALQDDLFAADTLLDLTLEADLKPLLRDTSEDRPYRPARLWYRDDAGDTVSFDIGAKTRGYYRRKFLDCDVPPLRLNFKKKQTRQTVFAGQDKLKLVTHCRNKSDSYQQYTLQEYLLYKTYNLLTDNSFRVRLVRITYTDSTARRDPVTRYGFLIEDEDRLAERLGGRSLETGVIHQEATDREQATVLAVFQYLAGNTDWSVPAHHNIKFVYFDAETPPLAVPYDFDMAGLISTPYAKPDPRLGIRSVRERLFRGYCRTEGEFAAVFARFNAQQDAIYALFRDFPHLDDKHADRALDYLDDFYETINAPKRIKREFLRVCLEK